MKNNDKNIIIKGARQHNLKNIDLELPRNKLIVFTGVSGSGKSSLAFDTIFAEGQRRYIESLSTYARQFLGQLNKPDVDYIEGLSPAISIDQKSTSHNPRSTVGTVTEIYDYLRLLYARIGKPHCPECGLLIEAQTIDQIVDQVMKFPEGTKFQVLSPIVRGRKGEYKKLFEELRKEGFVRVRVDGKIYDIEEQLILDKNKKHDIAVIVDRLILKPDIQSRLSDSISTAMSKTDGLVLINLVDNNKDILFSENFACINCGISIGELSPRMFSFNSPYGACPACHGIGFKNEIVISKVIPVPEKSIMDGAILPFSRSGKMSPYYETLLKSLSNCYKFDLNIPFKNLSPEIQQIILFGSKDKIRIQFDNWKERDFTGSYYNYFEGVINILNRRYTETESEESRKDIERYMEKIPCKVCNGKRLKKESLAVKINNLSIVDVTSKSTIEVKKWLNNLILNERDSIIAQQILKELNIRLQFLIDVGLDYLTIDRLTSTLSGGEAQRIRLSSQIGSGLVGVLYILDEPSIGLHPRDNTKLLNTLKHLRDIGNTLIVVEHDKETILSADHIVDIGPGAGRNGGEIVAQGTLQDIINEKKSITGEFLNGREIFIPKRQRNDNGYKLIIKGARKNNLKNIYVEIPLGKFVCITGVSGSGKSTLINDILYPYLKYHFFKRSEKPKDIDEIIGLEFIDKVINIDQSPIGRTPRSNPATYTNLFSDIRETFALTTEARIRGYKQGRFSFNVKGGRCEACHGDGMIKIEMNFLPDVYIPCEVCKGKRYNRETLEVKFKGKNIAEVLDMTVDEALEIFGNIPKARKKLKTLQEVGLGYIQLGQPAPTLSGGEAQRVKLATELCKRSTGKTMYLLDEPTTGLHFADVEKLLYVLHKLVDKGNTVIVIEHNLDVIKTSDYIIDLGPEGGDRGGEVIAIGPPENIIKNKNSYTGSFLKKMILTEDSLIVVS